MMLFAAAMVVSLLSTGVAAVSGEQKRLRRFDSLAYSQTDITKGLNLSSE